MAYGDVRRAPYAAARSLIDWGTDLWPYVNGKAITHGLSLKEMDASDMLDVLHFFFEEEFTSIQTGEQAEARDKARDTLYSLLYNREYKHSFTSGSRSTGMLDSELEIEDIPEPIDPFQRSKQTKAYVPPTRMSSDSSNPYGSVLDSPLG